MIERTLKDRPFLQMKLWLTAAAQVFRQRITMLWLFYFNHQQETKF